MKELEGQIGVRKNVANQKLLVYLDEWYFDDLILYIFYAQHVYKHCVILEISF